ncbi:MAG: MBL fold metallo-hydrolase [Firmicutes bacterium]|nr:MBL fold metallo-hydrolase [Bacillota bacterium]
MLKADYEEGWSKLAVREVAEGVFLIDAFDMGIPNRTSVYLVRDERSALIDTGAAHSRERLILGLQETGLEPRDLQFIILTHIHVDHAGGAGWLLELFPDARVIVHPRGAPHLAAPADLKAATRKARMAYPFHPCEFLPIPEEKMEAARDSRQIPLGRRTLTLLETPGHASHCICIHDDLTNGIFVGDSLGVKIDHVRDHQKYEIFLPAMVPPRFEPQEALRSADKLAAFQPKWFYYSHFGASPETERLLAKYRNVVERAFELAESLKKEEADEAAACTRLYNWLLREVLEIPQEVLGKITAEIKLSLELNIHGLVRYIAGKRSA